MLRIVYVFAAGGATGRSGAWTRLDRRRLDRGAAAGPEQDRGAARERETRPVLALRLPLCQRLMPSLALPLPLCQRLMSLLCGAADHQVEEGPAEGCGRAVMARFERGWWSPADGQRCSAQ